MGERTSFWSVAVLAFLAGSAVRAACRVPPPAEAKRIVRTHAATLDPRTMSARELRRLPGIGRKRALAVLLARRAVAHDGPPLSWSDVYGIGPETERRVKSWLLERGADPAAPLAGGAQRPIAAATITRASWLASDERPPQLDVGRVDAGTDRNHVVLAASPSELPLDGDRLGVLRDCVPTGFRLVPGEGEAVAATAVRDVWCGSADGRPYLYFLLRLEAEARESLAAGATYRIVPALVEGESVFRTAVDLGVVAPR